MDWKVGANLLNIQSYIQGGADAVKRNKDKIIKELEKIEKRKRYICEDLYDEAKRLKGLFGNGTDYSIIYSSLAGFISRFRS